MASESKVIDFLRTERWDPLKAATRLALYWKYRQHLFGEERWALPMTQTGTGALSTEDIEILRSGYMVGWNNHLKPLMVLADLSRLPRTAARANTRLQFYYATIFTNALLQTEGIVIVQVITSDRRPELETDPENWQMIGTALPMRMKGIIIGQAYEEGKERLIETYAEQYQLITQYKTGVKAPMLKANSSRSIYDLFHRHGGMDQDQLPPCLGGTYQYTEFADWVRMRLSMEAGSTLVPRRVFSASQVAMPPSHVFLDIDTDPRKKEEAVYAGFSLQDKAKFLRQDNRRIREENIRLEQVLEQVRQIFYTTQPQWQEQQSDKRASEIALASRHAVTESTFVMMFVLETTPPSSPSPEESHALDLFDSTRFNSLTDILGDW